MSSTETEPIELPEQIRLRRLPPKSRRHRNAPPEWEVMLDGTCIGWIAQWKVASATATFYRATAIHPTTGTQIPLESNTDLAERVERVVAAWTDPAPFVRKSSWE